ncbi:MULTISPECIES: hypothetical protein [Actinomadura]|uniref:Secreted protein n=1 Tax=Actinomadura litoris TaxID=2678616 RepID=A0A7K1L296_9ACTN|nr:MULTISPECIES: hypothetical protein [Actinomadura]MBT2208928.1 hypothetical protein [Actinomadura sp. NEAU-AAG7]MUN38507.1 hypothetical protein [Actinomadura litoris]
MRRFSSVLALASSAAILISALTAAPAHASRTAQSPPGTECVQVVPNAWIALVCMVVRDGQAQGTLIFINPANVRGAKYYVTECANGNCTRIDGPGSGIIVPAVPGRTYATCGGVLLSGQRFDACTQPVTA